VYRSHLSLHIMCIRRQMVARCSRHVAKAWLQYADLSCASCACCADRKLQRCVSTEPGHAASKAAVSANSGTVGHPSAVLQPHVARASKVRSKPIKL
jgi:hypothetical protein